MALDHFPASHLRHAHPHAAPRPQRHERLHPHLPLPVDQVELRSPHDRGEEQVPLHQREVIPDADPRPGAERQVRAAGELLLAVAEEAARIERVRIGEQIRPAVDPEDVHEDDLILPDPARLARARPRHHDVSQRPPPDDVRRRVEAHGLLENRERVGERLEVLHRERRPAARQRRSFFLRTSAEERVAGEEIQRPDERVRRRFVAGEEERHRFVADLAVAHRAPVLVPRGEEEAQEVPAARRARAPLGDEAVDDPVEARAGAAARQVSRRRHQGGHRQDRPERREGVLHHLGDRAAHRRAPRPDLRVEERLAHDLERQAHHRVRRVERVPFAPGADGPRGALGHRVCVRGDPLVGERRRDQTTLARVGSPLAREEPVAEERAEEDREPERLVEALGLRLE